MTENDPISSYQQASACGATPVGQIVALYDTILRDFSRALAAQQARAIETRVLELNHALLVIGHMQSILDHERGGQPAKHLDRFYDITRGMILDANVRPTPEAFEKLIDLYAGLRKAWQQAEQELAREHSQALPEETGGRGQADGPVRSTEANGDPEASQIQWSA
jgi:flagellar protein FliS